METLQIRSENETTEEDMDLISFRKTNTSIEENYPDFPQSKQSQNPPLPSYQPLKSSVEEIKCDEDFHLAESVEK